MGFNITQNRKFQKNSKKIQKIRKHHQSFFSNLNRLWKAEKERKLKKSFLWIPIRPGIENSKEIAKKFKKLENTIIASFQAKITWEMPRNGENWNYRSVPFRSYPTRNRKFQKNIKKIKKYHYGFISSQNRLDRKSVV